MNTIHLYTLDSLRGFATLLVASFDVLPICAGKPFSCSQHCNGMADCQDFTEKCFQVIILRFCLTEIGQMSLYCRS
jgi:hypothetical protein